MKPLALLCLAIVTGADPTAARTCLTNETGETLFLAVDDGRTREAGPRDPGTGICIDASGRTTVSAFLSETDLEGCSRRTDAGRMVAITAFQGVDRCLWTD